MSAALQLLVQGSVDTQFPLRVVSGPFCFFQKISEKGLLKLLGRDKLGDWHTLETVFCPPGGWVRVSSDFLSIHPLIDLAASVRTNHPQWMSCVHCELSELLKETRPPDLEFVVLIERAFLEGQIDGLRADLAYFWLLNSSYLMQNKCGTFCGTF